MNRRGLVLVLVLLSIYAALSHYSNSNPSAKTLGAILSVGPIALLGIALMWRCTPHWVAACVTFAVGYALYHYRTFLEDRFEWSDMIQQAGAYGIVCLSFARSLYGGRVPLCTQLALRMHGSLEPKECAYTHRATWVWACFYFALASSIVMSFFCLTRNAWSLFVNFATFGLIVLGCLVDYALRRRLLPVRPGGGLMTLLQRSLIG